MSQIIFDQLGQTSVKIIENLQGTKLVLAKGSDGTTPSTTMNAGFFYESVQDLIVARAGGGQTLATQLTAQTSRVTTVATAGDSVKLPASAPGLELLVINHGANPMQVYGAGTDTIDDVATATGVSHMVNSLVIYTCATAGAWYSEGLATGFGGPGLQTESYASGLTAHAGGGQGAALQLSAMINRVTTVTSAGDSVVLPTSAAGLLITVINSGANSMQVFGLGTDSINGAGSAVGVPQQPGSVIVYNCPVAGTWVAQVLPLYEKNTAITTVGAGTLTAAALVGAVVTRSGSTAAYTDTTDTAANIVLALHAGGTVGQSWEVTIKNTVAFAETLAAGAGVTLSGQTVIPPNSSGRFLLTYSAAGAVTMQGLTMTPLAPLASTLFSAVSGNTPLTLLAANMASAQDVTANLTAVLAGAGTVTTDTAANIVAAMPNAIIGQTYRLRIINSSSAAFSWTVAAGVGVTLAGTMTIAQNTWRDFYVTLTSLTAVSIQSIGTGTFS